MDGLPPKKRFIESSSFYTNNESVDPFSNMKINDSSFLDSISFRGMCHLCNRSRKYYCYTCYVPIEEVTGRLPILSLPIKIDIIKHPREVDGKSTSAHAAVLAPDDVKIYTYPNFPSYENEKVLLIFPGNSAISFQEWWNMEVNPEHVEKNSTQLCNKASNPEIKPLENCFEMPFTKAIFIDSTWRQSKALYSDPRLNSLPCVILSTYKSLFWRHQRGKPETYLATVEAVYYFLCELYGLMHPQASYRGQYDNMLFLFKFMYCKLRSVYDLSSSKIE